MTPDRAARGGRGDRRTRRAGGLGRHHTGNASGGRGHWRTIHFVRLTNAFGPGPRPLHGGATGMNTLPMIDQSPAAPTPEYVKQLQDEVQDAQGRAQRGDPGPQLPAARGPGQRRLRRRLARPLAAGGQGRRRRDRLLRRPLHGRDRVGAVPGSEGPDSRPGRRLLAGRLDHGRPATRLEGRAPGRDRRDVRQHLGRGQGRDRLLLHVGQRRARRRAHLQGAR